KCPVSGRSGFLSSRLNATCPPSLSQAIKMYNFLYGRNHMQRQGSRQSVNSSNVLSIIMGGGQGKRLFPLTKERAKPAVPLAGKYRLVDIPISNCINSSLRRIYLLTQFNSAS